jgi:hypothetical protein
MWLDLANRYRHVGDHQMADLIIKYLDEVSLCHE